MVKKHVAMISEHISHPVKMRELALRTDIGICFYNYDW